MGKIYQITNKDFMSIENLVSDIYNTLIIVDYFCSHQKEIEELNNLSPIIKSIRHTSDLLTAYFINYQDTNDKT